MINGATKCEVIRMLKGWNKTRLAAVADVRMSIISDVENGKEIRPDIKTKVSKALGCSEEELQEVITAEQFLEMSRDYAMGS